MSCGQPHADRASEVVQDQGDVGEVEREDQAFQIVDVVLQPIAARLWRLALPEAHVIGDDHPVRAAQSRDQAAEQVTPGRLPVQAQHDLAAARALVDIVHLEPGGGGEMRREGEGAAEGSVGSDHGRTSALWFHLETTRCVALEVSSCNR
jgi:hypothetical protein